MRMVQFFLQLNFSFMQIWSTLTPFELAVISIPHDIAETLEHCFVISFNMFMLFYHASKKKGN